jgi:hypothetical protein
MTDRWTDAEITARLHSMWTSELARAEADYQAFPARIATRVQLILPMGAIVIAVAVLALAVVLRQVGGVPSPGSNGIKLVNDGLPVAISGETVFRGDQIAQRLAGGPATAFLAGGRLLVDGTGCSNGPSGASCVEIWQLVSVDGTGPTFRLEGAADAAGFVRTAGVLTVLRVEPIERPACGSIACPNELTASAVLWRAPTKGRIPSDASSNDGAIYDALWPDFVATYGRDGETVAGYIPKADLLGKHDAPLPVYGEDLQTLVGYQVAGQGFVPIGEYHSTPAPSAPPVDGSPLEILTAYLQAVEDRNCPAAMIVAAPTNIAPTTNALCSSSARVTAFEVDPASSQPIDDTVVFSVTMTTTGGAFNLPDGPNAWYFTLTKQPTGAWRVSEGGPA